MRTVILSLAIAGLSLSNDCSANPLNWDGNKTSFVQKVGLVSQKPVARKTVKVVSVVGVSVLACYTVSHFFGPAFVNAATVLPTRSALIDLFCAAYDNGKNRFVNLSTNYVLPTYDYLSQNKAVAVTTGIINGVTTFRNALSIKNALVDKFKSVVK